MTDKEKIREEVERLFKENRERSSIEGYAAVEQLRKVLAFIDSLEVKEVDLEKELDSYFAKFKGLEKNNWNWRIDSINIHAQGIYDFAKHFFELGLQT